MAAMTTSGSISPAVPAAKPKGKAPAKKGMNPFAKKGSPPAGSAAQAKAPPFGKKGPVDPKTLADMKGSLKAI